MNESQEKYHCLLRVLLILVNIPQTLQPVNDDMKVQPCWELQNVQGGTFLWNREEGQFNCINESDQNMDESIHKLLDEIVASLRTEFIKNNIQIFEVRPVLASKK